MTWWPTAAERWPSSLSRSASSPPSRLPPVMAVTMLLSAVTRVGLLSQRRFGQESDDLMIRLEVPRMDQLASNDGAGTRCLVRGRLSAVRFASGSGRSGTVGALEDGREDVQGGSSTRNHGP